MDDYGMVIDLTSINNNSNTAKDRFVAYSGYFLSGILEMMMIRGDQGNPTTPCE